MKMAGLPNGDRFDPQAIPRPGLYSQHSNSVPSTPYQKPRDLRFHSRSPSPNRGIASQSPRSVVSEAPGTQTANRTQPVVCKYEQGDEMRKRRIPYIDGGHEELGPAKKEPKKTLQPDEQERLSGDMRELYDRLLPSEESEKRRLRLLEKLHRILNDKWPGNDIRVNVFGSSGNLLSSTDSDVDICITTPDKQVVSMHSLAALLASHGMEKVVCRAAAKVPIVKCWDPELQLAADLNVNNTLALQNTRMIKVYIQLDPRVRPLAKIIKYWTKRRLLNDAAFGGTISSYTWICMIISFLQRRNPPILPSLQQMRDCRNKTESGQPSPFADDLDALKAKEFGKNNKESLGELLFQFYRHYGYEFEFGKYVVSVKEGRLLSREEKGWDAANWKDKESRNRLCVEEPFTANRNLGNSADDYAWHGIHLEIRRAFELLEDGLQLEKCCEQFEFPPEESRPIFQKPPPKPKPTLTRSVSQSNRTNHEPGSGRSRKNNNRNQSNQRSGNRRASSGASFTNSRQPFSPQLGSNPGDYFNMKGNLHEQLYQQYQFLQAQQEHLRQQLAMHTQATAAQGRVGDLAGAGSPRPRQFINGGLPSPRMSDHPPQTAPLLPGYLYHYPPRPYPPQSPMSQARSRESTGTNTNPSSPSLVAAVPALRRNGHRASVPDGSASSVRSQSQPGRSLPPMLTLQQQMQAGYELPSALGAQMTNVRSASQAYQQGQGVPLPLSHFPGVHANGHTGHAMDGNLHQPKEYVGYYVGQSPQLGPQQYASNGQMPPPMTLRDPPQRPRRVTPDLAPPLVNGRHSSRSPSPLGHMRSFSTTTGDPRLNQSRLTQSPTTYNQSESINAAFPPPVPVIANGDVGGPVIVNGSNYSSHPKAAEKVNGVPGPSVQLDNEIFTAAQSEDPLRIRPLPIRTDFDTPQEPKCAGNRQPSDAVSPTSLPKPDRRSSLSPNGTTPHTNGFNSHYPETNPLTAPLLSPVVELRTPSPTQARAFDNTAAEANGNLFKATKIPAAKQAANENVPPKTETRPTHQRKGSAPMLSTPGPAPVPTKTMNVQSAAPAKNEWQTAGSLRNKHKKSKSNAGAKMPNGPGGQPMPANEAERKGG